MDLPPARGRLKIGHPQPELKHAMEEETVIQTFGLNDTVWTVPYGSRIVVQRTGGMKSVLEVWKPMNEWQGR